MKVLYIGHEKTLSGASRSLLEMLEQVSSAHEVHVLSAFREGAFVEAVCTARYHLVWAPFYRWRLHFRGNGIVKILKKNVYRILQIVNYVSLPFLIRYIKREEIDLIHTNTTSTNLGCILARCTGIPHVMHVREFGEEDFDMTFLWGEKKCYQTIDNGTDHYIYISQAVEKKYQDKLQGPGRVIYNGVSVAYQCDSHVRSKTGDSLNLLIAGRIEPAKGQEEAIRALASLYQRGICGVKLYIAGLGDTTALKDLAERLAISDQIIFLGHQKDMVAVRRQMDVELVCSRCEAFGRVTVEAMMNGMPVIGSAAGGTIELICHGSNGMLYRPGDPEDLADRIEEFYQDRQMLEDMSRQAMTYARETYTAERNGREVLALYEEIAGKS